MKKYKLGEKDETTGLYRIIALRDFVGVAAGELGGLIASEDNLSQEGGCWVYGAAQVCGDALVCDDARVSGDALVHGNARVHGNALVCGTARVCGDARVYGDTRVTRCLFLQQFKYNITVTDTHYFIGCEGHTHDYWAEHITEIGLKHAYSVEEIEETRALLGILYAQIRR